MNVEDLYRLLRTDHVQAQGIVDTVADPLLVLDGSLRIQNASRSFYETFKVDRYETIGQHLHELGNGQWNIPELRHLLSDVIPKSAAVINYRVEHEFPELGSRTMLLTARTLFHPDRPSGSLLLSIVDVTDRSRQDAEKDLLFGELRHRMRNLLAMAQAIAFNSSTDGLTALEFRDIFLGRFGALVHSQELAFADQGATDMAALVDRTLSPYAASPAQIVVEPGPRIELSPRIVTPLGLVLHELATNAAKYGALSKSDGRLRVCWRLEENGDLHLTWAESGGAPVNPPTRTGYGTQLIQSATTYSLGGRVEQDYGGGALTTEIVVPLR